MTAISDEETAKLLLRQQLFNRSMNANLAVNYALSVMEGATNAVIRMMDKANTPDELAALFKDMKERVRLNTEVTPKGVLLPIETAPKNGNFVLLFGPSGYGNTPMRCEVCCYDKEYRPLQPWVTYGGQSFEDSGSPATHWMPLPNMPIDGWPKP